MARVELSNTWLLSGNIVSARAAADGFLGSALSTSDPHLQALGWELQARVALAESDLPGARESIQRALAIADSSEIQCAAWQVYATAWQFHRRVKEHKVAEMNRQRSENCILRIANSFAPDEPLRTSFMSAAPVRRVLGEKPINTTTRKHRLGRAAAS